MRERDPQKIKDFLGEEICRNLPESFKELYQRIMHVILKFLQSEEKILFIQFPIEELTNKEKKQDKYWNEICDVISYAIRLSMTSRQLQPSELSYPGDWYSPGDKFLLIPSNETDYPYYFLQENNGKIKFSCVNRNYAPTIPLKNSLIKSASSIYRLTEIPGQIKNGYKRCVDEISLLKCGNFANQELSSAVAICSAFNEPLPHAGTYVTPVVDIRHANRCYPESDILAIVGDKAFWLVQGAVNSVTPNGPIKKLVVFGTQPTAYLLESNPVTITLSFKEMHEYCAPRRVSYSDPKFIEIDFPWLKDVLSKLKLILEECLEQLGDTNSKHIYNLTRSILADIEFSSEKLDGFKKYFVRFLDESIGDNDCPYNKIMEWLEGLSYDSDTNPKQDYAKGTSGKIILSDRSIYKQLKGIETYGSKLILDSPCHRSKGENNPISEVMRYNLFPKLSCLYYKDIESLIMNRAKKNISEDPFFSADAVPSESHTEVSNVVNLEDYFDLDTYQREFYSLVYGGENVVFTDGSYEQLSGDVILSMDDESLERKPVTDIMNRKGETIIFYSLNADNRDLFNCLFNKFYDFPEDRNVDYYVELWQKAFEILIQDTPQESLDSLCQKLNISKATMNNHINGRSRFINKQKFSKVLDMLVDKELIDKEDLKYIKASQAFYNSSSISFGYKLKDALYRFRIDENDKSDFIKDLEKKTSCKIKDFIDKFLMTKTIKE